MQPQSTELTATVESLRAHLRHVEYILRRRVELGHPNHPEDPTDTTLAGSTPAVHNGRLDNVFGSWVEVELGEGDLGAAIPCYHNLGVAPLGVATPNVRWIMCGAFHSGAGPAGATSTISVDYQTLDVVTANYIELRFRASPLRTVDEDNKLKVTLFFIPAVWG